MPSMDRQVTRARSKMKLHVDTIIRCSRLGKLTYVIYSIFQNFSWYKVMECRIQQMWHLYIIKERTHAESLVNSITNTKHLHLVLQERWCGEAFGQSNHYMTITALESSYIFVGPVCSNPKSKKIISLPASQSLVVKVVLLIRRLALGSPRKPQEKTVENKVPECYATVRCIHSRSKAESNPCIELASYAVLLTDARRLEILTSSGV